MVCLASLLPCEDVVQCVCAYLVCRYVLVLMSEDSLAPLSIRSLMNGNRIFDIVEAHCYILYRDDEGLRGLNVLQSVAID